MCEGHFCNYLKIKDLLDRRFSRIRKIDTGVLTSVRAVQVNVAIMRTFVRLRQLLATHEELARRLEQLEWRQYEQAGQIETVFQTIQQLIEAPVPEPQTVEPKRRIGFPTAEDDHGTTE